MISKKVMAGIAIAGFFGISVLAGWATGYYDDVPQDITSSAPTATLTAEQIRQIELEIDCEVLDASISQHMDGVTAHLDLWTARINAGQDMVQTDEGPKLLVVEDEVDTYILAYQLAESFLADAVNAGCPGLEVTTMPFPIEEPLQHIVYEY
ncbi:MAG: hypothetical protein OXM00_08970 [Paracoccaceae bacterium]|nr:hypothetical protein [Nitrososphaerota archaeon]MDE2917348.1 hypothetical protein [Paracoccaceae bacterium]